MRINIEQMQKPCCSVFSYGTWCYVTSAYKCTCLEVSVFVFGWSDILHKACTADGALESITKHGAGETVDDRVQSAVEIGEGKGHHKALDHQLVGCAAASVDPLDVHRPQACDDTWYETDGEHKTDHHYCSDGPLYVILLTANPQFTQRAGNTG